MAKRKAKAAVEDVMPESGIFVRNEGPINECRFDGVPGSVTLITGSNSTGKSHFQKAARALATGDTSELSLREGEKEGLIAGWGRTIKIFATVCKVSGNFEIGFFEESFTLATFVDPGSTAADVAKRAKTNDRDRIKALSSILDISIKDEDVYRLVANKQAERLAIQQKIDQLHPAAEMQRKLFLEEMAALERLEKSIARSVIADKTWGISDPAEYVACIKRDIDRAANDKEREAEVLNGQADGKEETLPDSKKTGETDEEILSQAVANAQNKKQELENRRKAADDAKALADAAQTVLNAGQGESVEEAQAAYDAKAEELGESDQTLIDLQKMIDDERRNNNSLRIRAGELEIALNSAKRRQEKMDKARKDLEEKIFPPTDEEWAEVEQQIKDASDAMILGADLRRAADVREEIADLRQDANELAAQAAHLRSAATGVLNLLVGPINSLKCGIEIDDEMRVIADDPVRGRGYYEELSDGARWKAVFRLMTMMSIGTELPALVPLPQRVWLELDPKSRQEFIDEVAKTKLIVYVLMATSKQETGPDGKTLFSDEPISSTILAKE